MASRASIVGLLASLAACSSAAPRAKPAASPPPVVRSLRAAAPPLTPDAVLSTIQSKYLRDLQRCYGRQLKKHPRLAGRVTVMLTVSETGKLSEGKARGVTTAVESCVERAMERWSFPPPRTAEESFQLSFQLRPT